MISSVTAPASAPVHVRATPPAVAPVGVVSPAAGAGLRGEPGPARPGVAAPPVEDLVPTPPEPVSTQSVLLLRQNGNSIAGIAEAYGMTVDAVRQLMQAGREEAERLSGAARTED